jgi:recombinational DNA repair protein RecT
MYRKTVIKQLSKTLPKNDMFARAIEEDNKDSKISD